MFKQKPCRNLRQGFCYTVSYKKVFRQAARCLLKNVVAVLIVL